MRQQQIRYAATSAVAIILVAALVAMINWIGARRYHRADWTRTQVYTLSDKTEGIVAGLEDEIRVIVFMTEASPQYEQVHELLDRYSAASDKIKVQYIDPDREPLKSRQLAEQFGISVADTVVFAYGERSKYVTADEMAEYDYAGMQYGAQPSVKAFRGEEQFTAAILSLVAPRVPRVYFVTGHGEASTSGGGSVADRSLAALQEAVRRENMSVDDHSLLSGTIPEDADVLAIIGPTEPYTEHEIQLLEGFLDSGGRLLVCLDPLIEPAGGMRTTRLETFLAGRGVEVRDDLVVDPSRRLPFFDLSAVYLTDFRTHPVTTGLDGVAVLFPVTRSLAASSGEGFTARAIVETTSGGWGETNLGQLLAGEPVDEDEDDHAGPVAVVVAVEASSIGADPGEGEEMTADEPAASGFRMLVCGDSDFLVDNEISSAGNLTIALNAFNWLASRDESVGIPPRQVEQVSLYLSSDQMSFVYLVVIVLVPGAAIALGVLVWRRRRH